MGVDQHRLRVGVADDAYAGISDEFLQFVLETASEISVFQVMDAAEKAAVFLVSFQSGPFGSQMAVVVGTVKKVHSTRLLANDSAKSSHYNRFVKFE